MTTFKPGDLVRCIDNRGAPDVFTEGKIYMVESVEPAPEGPYVYIKGLITGMYAHRFELLSHVRVRTAVEPGSFAGVSWAPHANGIEVGAGSGSSLVLDRADLETLSAIFADLAKTLA